MRCDAQRVVGMLQIVVLVAMQIAVGFVLKELLVLMVVGMFS